MFAYVCRLLYCLVIFVNAIAFYMLAHVQHVSDLSDCSLRRWLEMRTGLKLEAGVTLADSPKQVAYPIGRVF